MRNRTLFSRLRAFGRHNPSVPDRDLAYSTARAISIVAHPFSLAAALLLFGTIKAEGASKGLSSALIVLALVILPLALFMVWRYRSGSWSTIDASEKKERPIMFVVGLLLLVALLLVLRDRPDMAYLTSTIVGVIGLLSLSFLLNRWIKASLHVAFCGFCGAIALPLIAPLGTIFLGLLPLLAWARVRMRRHSYSEVIVGACAGLAVGAIVVLA